MRRMRRQVRWSDDGAAAVEFALLFPIFIIVVMGMISAGTAFSKQINIVQASRETSRFGATLTYNAAAGGGTSGTVTDWLNKVSAVGQAAAGPSSDPIGGHNRLCVAMIDLTDLAVPALTRMVDGGVAETGKTCAPDGTSYNANLGPKYVQVALERQTNFFAVFVNKDLTLRSASTTPYEPGTSGVTTP